MPRWIDMRDEMRALIHGDRRTVAQGRWIVIRIMRVGQYSPYWNEDVKEAIGGPKWNYDDFPVRTISKPGRSGTVIGIAGPQMSDLEKIGYDNVKSNLYAIEYNPAFPRLPDEEDIIYEIDKHNSRTRPLPPLRVTDRFKIDGSIPDYGDDGRVELLYLIAHREHGEA